MRAFMGAGQHLNAVDWPRLLLRGMSFAASRFKKLHRSLPAARVLLLFDI
jgi:hypothetical protein